MKLSNFFLLPNPKLKNDHIRKEFEQYLLRVKFSLRNKMNYKEAIARTIKLQEYATEFNHKNILYIVVPADYQEMKLYLDDYYKPTNSKEKPDCKKYSSDGNFSIYRVDADSQVLSGVNVP